MKNEVCEIIKRSGFRIFIEYYTPSSKICLKHVGSNSNYFYVLEILDPEETLFNIYHCCNPENYNMILSSFLNINQLENILCTLDNNIHFCRNLFKRITDEKDGIMMKAYSDSNNLENYEAREYYDGFYFCACNQCWLVLPIDLSFSITNPKTGYTETCSDIYKVEKRIIELVVLT